MNKEYIVNENELELPIGERPYKFPVVRDGQIASLLTTVSDAEFPSYRAAFVERVLTSIIGRKPLPTDYMNFKLYTIRNKDLVIWKDEAIGEIEYTELSRKHGFACEFLYTPLYIDEMTGLSMTFTRK